jgi:hypothetical protein
MEVVCKNQENIIITFKNKSHQPHIKTYIIKKDAGTKYQQSLEL